VRTAAHAHDARRQGKQQDARRTHQGRKGRRVSNALAS
jgi:hypothetical protein